METGIPALFIAAIFMLFTVLVSRGGFAGMDAVSQSLKASETRLSAQTHTGLSVTGTSIDGTGANITVTIRNDGQTPIAEFARMDVVVQYFDEFGARYDKWLAYTSGALASDTWTTGAFTSDLFEPRILNTGETVQILMRVNPVIGVATTNKALIGTDHGVTVQTLFAGPP